jgi:phage-related protein
MPDYILGSGVTNIARVPAFEVGDSYSLNDIIYFSGYTIAGSPAVEHTAESLGIASGHYYYSGAAGASTAANSPAGASTVWTQDLFFKPSYPSSVEYENNTYDVTFGDGYYNILNKSENSLVVKFNYNFAKRDDKEAKALIHLAEDSFNKGLKPSGGYTGVFCTPFAPYDKRHEFYIDTFDRSFEYPNVNNITFQLDRENQSLLDWQGYYIPFSQTRGFFEEGLSYSKHDIVYLSGTNTVANDRFKIFQSGWYYYSGDTETTANTLNSPTGDNTLWTKDTFYFDLDEGLSVQEAPRYLKMSAQNGYFVRADDGLNKSLLNMEFSLEGRTDKEAKAIVHFFESHQGKNQFKFTPPAPYDAEEKVFFCPKWTHTLNFKENNSVNINLIEFPINLIDNQVTFSSLITTDPYFVSTSSGPRHITN